ncbi:MAG: hypothetical protein NG712_00400 [Omnitrophica bacterium]|nr:hypothetical protein [Candidatus Omnitrophota bacterium]
MIHRPAKKVSPPIRLSPTGAKTQKKGKKDKKKQKGEAEKADKRVPIPRTRKVYIPRTRQFSDRRRKKPKSPRNSRATRNNNSVFRANQESVPDSSGKVPPEDSAGRKHNQKKISFSVKKSPQNPILEPIKGPGHEWESAHVFHPAAFYWEGKYYLLYRARGEDGVDRLGLAISENGADITERLKSWILGPDDEKLLGEISSEDPRAVIIGDRLYVTYTAVIDKLMDKDKGTVNLKPVIASMPIAQFIENAKKLKTAQWIWEKTPAFENKRILNKNLVLFPRAIGGKFFSLHRQSFEDKDKHWTYNGIQIAYADQVTGPYSGTKEIIRPRKGKWDSHHIGSAAPPIETEDGWLLFYHGSDGSGSNGVGVYRVGYVLLDKDNPTVVLERSEEALFEPSEDYETTGRPGEKVWVPNVVFPCGAVIKGGGNILKSGDTIFVYYGAADHSVAQLELTYQRGEESGNVFRRKNPGSANSYSPNTSFGGGNLLLRHHQADLVIQAFPKKIIKLGSGYKKKAWHEDLPLDLDSENAMKIQQATEALKQLGSGNKKILSRALRFEEETTVVEVDLPSHFLNYGRQATGEVYYQIAHIGKEGKIIYVSAMFLEDTEDSRYIAALMYCDQMVIEDYAPILARGEIVTYQDVQQAHERAMQVDPFGVYEEIDRRSRLMMAATDMFTLGLARQQRKALRDEIAQKESHLEKIRSTATVSREDLPELMLILDAIARLHIRLASLYDLEEDAHRKAVEHYKLSIATLKAIEEDAEVNVGGYLPVQIHMRILFILARQKMLIRLKDEFQKFSRLEIGRYVSAPERETLDAFMEHNFYHVRKAVIEILRHHWEEGYRDNKPGGELVNIRKTIRFIKRSQYIPKRDTSQKADGGENIQMRRFLKLQISLFVRDLLATEAYKNGKVVLGSDFDFQNAEKRQAFVERTPIQLTWLKETVTADDFNTPIQFCGVSVDPKDKRIKIMGYALDNLGLRFNPDSKGIRPSPIVEIAIAQIKDLNDNDSPNQLNGLIRDYQDFFFGKINLEESDEPRTRDVFQAEAEEGENQPRTGGRAPRRGRGGPDKGRNLFSAPRLIPDAELDPLTAAMQEAESTNDVRAAFGPSVRFLAKETRSASGADDSEPERPSLASRRYKDAEKIRLIQEAAARVRERKPKVYVEDIAADPECPLNKSQIYKLLGKLNDESPGKAKEVLGLEVKTHSLHHQRGVEERIVERLSKLNEAMDPLLKDNPGTIITEPLLAREIGIDHTTLNNWLKRHEDDPRVQAFKKRMLRTTMYGRICWVVAQLIVCGKRVTEDTVKNSLKQGGITSKHYATWKFKNRFDLKQYLLDLKEHPLTEIENIVDAAIDYGVGYERLWEWWSKRINSLTKDVTQIHDFMTEHETQIQRIAHKIKSLKELGDFPQSEAEGVPDAKGTVSPRKDSENE